MNSVEFKSDRTKPATKSYKNYDNLFVYDTRNLLSNSIDIKYKKISSYPWFVLSIQLLRGLLMSTNNGRSCIPY